MGVTPNIGRFDPIFSSCGTHVCFVFVPATPQSLNRDICLKTGARYRRPQRPQNEVILALKRAKLLDERLVGRLVLPRSDWVSKGS